MTSDKTFTLSEAARATGKSLMTIRAKLEGGKLPNAFQTPKGKTKTWNIPLTDLVAAGLLDSVEPASAITADRQTELELAALEVENRHLRERLSRAESELDQLRADYRRLSLGLLQLKEIETAQAQQARRTWLKRKARTNPLDTIPSWNSDTEPSDT